jgi:hypothetical protein
MLIFIRLYLKLFKLILVSPELEKLLLIVYLIFLPLLAFSPEINNKYSRRDLINFLKYILL